MNTKKIIGTAIGLNILQVIFIIIASILVEGKNQRYIVIIIVAAVCLCLINTGVTILSYFYLQKKRYDSLVTSMKNLEDLNLTLRMQRHDYLNQIQVVYGLLDINEFEEAKRYMNSVFKEMTKVSKALKTAQPAVNALLQAKLQMAEKQNVDMYLDIRTDLKALKIEPWELCKVLANIIDNGITALQINKDEKEIHIEILQREDIYYFEIKNNGPIISNEQCQLIFKEGYTTNKESGHGMGLYIVKKIVEEASGKIELMSNKEWTSFIISLPRKKV